MVKQFLRIYNLQSFIDVWKFKPTKATVSLRRFQTTNNFRRNLQRKSIYQAENMKKIRFRLTLRYLNFVKNNRILKKLETGFIGSVRFFRTFSAGVKNFYKDLKDYIRIVRRLNTPGLRDRFRSLTLREVEIYDQMPKDMGQLLPVLFITALPIICYVIIPVAYCFPRYLLSSHFWTVQQKLQFDLIIMKKRLNYNKPLLHFLRKEVENFKSHSSYQPMKNLLELLESGCQPNVEEILLCKEFFECSPFSLFYMKRKQVKYLLKIHNLRALLFKRICLEKRASILQEMDKAIVRGGGVHRISIALIKNACYIRGLSPFGMKNEDLIRWLSDWLILSFAIDKGALSLLLHCPLFLGCNEHSNLVLSGSKKMGLIG